MSGIFLEAGAESEKQDREFRMSEYLENNWTFFTMYNRMETNGDKEEHR